jgi:hypothetical protein
MSKRITIMIDEDIDKKLRLIISYSQIVNEALRKQLK